MLEKSPVTKKESLMDNLLNQLDSEVSRYYNTLNEIRSSRLTIQHSNNVSDEISVEEKQVFNEGILNKLESLIRRIRLLNDGAIEEAKLFKDYL